MDSTRSQLIRGNQTTEICLRPFPTNELAPLTYAALSVGIFLGAFNIAFIILVLLTPTGSAIGSRCRSCQCHPPPLPPCRRPSIHAGSPIIVVDSLLCHWVEQTSLQL